VAALAKDMSQGLKPHGFYSTYGRTKQAAEKPCFFAASSPVGHFLVVALVFFDGFFVNFVSFSLGFCVCGSGFRISGAAPP